MSIGAYIYLIRGNEFCFPYQECVESILPFCDGVHILIDPRFKDTESVVAKLNQISPKVFVHQEEFNLDDPGVDGKTKARAREIASEQPYDWLIQMDADEVFRKEDIPKIEPLLAEIDDNLISCGVINWFNGQHIKVNSPWTKERFTRNVSYITHGIPMQYRIERDDGHYYVDSDAPTDGAGYIDKGGNGLSSNATSYNDLEKFVTCSKGSCHYVNQGFYDSLRNDIWIHHYSWYSIPRRWQREATWDYFWGILRGKYKSLDDYENSEGKKINFFAVTKMRSPRTYLAPITDEMTDKMVYYVDWINHPKLMGTWIKDNKPYIYGEKNQKLCKPRFSLKSFFKFSKERVVFD